VVVVEIWGGRGRSGGSELGRAGTEDEDDYLPRFLSAHRIWGGNYLGIWRGWLDMFGIVG
jgi:hypothetical protein